MAAVASGPHKPPLVAGQETLPVIDGDASDGCWSEAPWYAIDQTWITWGEVIDSADYFGRFKVSWSEPEE